MIRKVIKNSNNNDNNKKTVQNNDIYSYGLKNILLTQFFQD